MDKATFSFYMCIFFSIVSEQWNRSPVLLVIVCNSCILYRWFVCFQLAWNWSELIKSIFNATAATTLCKDLFSVSFCEDMVKYMPGARVNHSGHLQLSKGCQQSYFYARGHTLDGLCDLCFPCTREWPCELKVWWENCLFLFVYSNGCGLFPYNAFPK